MTNTVSTDQRSFARSLRREMTRAEEILWGCLRGRRSGGAKFRRQVPIGLYVADFVCFDARLIVELDGPSHDHPERRAHDLARDVWFRENKFRILRFTNEQVMMDTDSVLQSICTALRPPT